MRSKKVAQYTLDGKFMRVYESAKVACKYFTNKPAISRAAAGSIKTAAGFQWRYYKDKPITQIDECLALADIYQRNFEL